MCRCASLRTPDDNFLACSRSGRYPENHHEINRFSSQIKHLDHFFEKYIFSYFFDQNSAFQFPESNFTFFVFVVSRGWQCFVSHQIDTKPGIKKSLGSLILKVINKTFFDQKFGRVVSEVCFSKNGQSNFTFFLKFGAIIEQFYIKSIQNRQ